MGSGTPLDVRPDDRVLAWRIASCFIGCVTAPFVFAATMGLTWSGVASWLAAAIGATILAALLWRRPAFRLELAKCPRALRVVAIVAAVAAPLLVSRLTVFMVDPSRTAMSIAPTSDWESKHFCFTAYFVAAREVRTHPNIYDPSLYELPGGDPTLPRRPKMLGAFRIDQYEYPPPFLLVPRVLSLALPEFLSERAFWFGLTGLILLGALVVTAREMGSPAATRALLLAPFVIAAPTTLSTFQKGNVQLVVIAVSMLAMTFVARRRHALGGALLAFVTVSKLYPALLIVYLLVRRDWRTACWTAGFALLFVLLTIADIGWAPFAAFREHMPGLLGGEAFPAFRNPAANAVNLSIPGLVFKLRLLGLSNGGFPAMHVVGTTYMLVAIALTVLLGIRATTDGPLIWLAILLAATLRSPFLPWTYAVFPAVWLATLLWASSPIRAFGFWGWLAVVIVLGIVIPIDAAFLSPPGMAVLSIIPQVVMVLLILLAARRALSLQAPGPGAAIGLSNRNAMNVA